MQQQRASLPRLNDGGNKKIRGKGVGRDGVGDMTHASIALRRELAKTMDCIESSGLPEFRII